MKSLVLLCAAVAATAVSACGGSDQLAKPAETTTTSGTMTAPRPCPGTQPPPPGSYAGSRSAGSGMLANPTGGVGPGYTPPASNPRNCR